MQVRVEFTGQLRTAVGRANDQVELPEGSTVGMLVAHLAQRWGEEARPHLLNGSNQAQPSLLVAINGTAFPTQQAAATVLRAGDTVVFLPPIAGG